ncbi:putative gTP cyclohydrolase 1 [Mycobacterium avium subsp. avium 2285 (R)]|nr:putative gTP cyclohydrolase 1 [Mycobacterium avium subsp. avium 2285 (R)]
MMAGNGSAPDTATHQVRQFDQARAEAAVRELLFAIGENPDRHGLAETRPASPAPTGRCSPACTPTRTAC